MVAPPVEGAANAALVRLLASVLDVPASAVRIAAGTSGRRKIVDVAGVDPGALRSRWPDLDV